MRTATALGRRPITGLVAVAAVTALALTGCSAGQAAQTVEQTSVVDGTAFQAGLIDLRDVGVRAPAGDSHGTGTTASLQGVLINSGRESDQLVSVTTPAAARVEFYADGVSAVIDGASRSASASGTPESSEVTTQGSSPGASSSSANSTGTPSGEDSGQASASASESASLGNSASSGPTSSSPLPTNTANLGSTEPLSSIGIDPHQVVRIGYSNSDVQIVLRDLTRDLFPSETVQMTFTFANAGAVTVSLGVKLVRGATEAAPSVDTGKEGE